jgi:hypothetical protein
MHAWTPLYGKFKHYCGDAVYKCQRETSIWSLNITFLKKNIFKSQDPKAFSTLTVIMEIFNAEN